MPAESALTRILHQPFRVMRVLAPHRLFWLGVPLLLYSWTIGGPHVGDDLNLVLKAERYLRGESREPRLYQFATTDAEWQELRDQGTVPWWVTTGAHLNFFRPVSEALFMMDVRLFGRNPLGPRLVSLAIFAMVLLSVHGLFVKTGADAMHAGLATFLYGVSQTVTPPVTWLCNRQDLLVVLGVTSAAAVYWSARTAPRFWQLPAVVVCCGFALLSKEVGVGLAAVLASYEVIEWRRSRTRSRIIAGAVCLLTAGFLAYYVYSRPAAFGVGEEGPTTSLIRRDLPISLLHYAAVWVIGVPIDVMHVFPQWVSYAVAVAAAILGIMTLRFLLRTYRGEPAAVFFLVWAICFIVPGLKALTASTRTLCTATVGWTYLVAALLVPRREQDAIVPLWFRHGLLGANVVVSIVAAVITVSWMNQWEFDARRRIMAAVTGANPPIRDGDALIIEKAESSMEAICAGDRLRYITGLRDISIYYLLGPDTAAVIQRTGPTSLRLVSSGPSLFGSMLHRVAQGRDWRPEPGKSMQLREFTARIGEVRGGTDVLSLDLEFKKPLDSASLHFYPARLSATIVDRTSKAGAP